MTRLFHVSDLHFGREDKAAVAWFARVVRDEMPSAVSCTGGLSIRARSRGFEAAGDHLDDLPVPVTVEPGNHDIPYHNLFDRFFSPYRRYGKVEKMVERPIDVPGVTVVPLKTTARAQWRTNWSWGVVSENSLARALALVRATDPAHLILVAAHHPLVDKEGLDSQAKTKGGREALFALAAAGAEAVLSGHVHDPFDMRHDCGGNTIRTIGAGTLSERTRATPPSFNELRIEGGKLEVVVRTLDEKPPEVLPTVPAPAA